MAERSLDVVHVHYAVPHALCAYLAKKMCATCGTKIVTTLHGTDITILGRDPAYRDVIRFGLRESDAVISVSAWLEQQTRETFAYDGPIHVVPNFVDQERFRPRGDLALRQDLAGGEDRPLLVHMSNFRALKRTRDTVDVLRRLDPAHGAILVLVGDGPDLTLVRDDATRYGLADRVRFLGEIDDVESVMAAADVALFPSESESFGLAALEAMACGVPVVAARVGGLPEVVDEATGFLHPVGDTAAMAHSVDALLADPERRHRMGEAALARATERFSLGASLEQHERLYAELLGLQP
jgi:N-acetyl-alpha-D-glucosaminyl L-malate synthase BshA